MSTPHEQGEIATTVDITREELVQEFPRLAPIGRLSIRSPDFERALPELLAASQRKRLSELRTEVGRLTAATDRLVGATSEAARTSERLYALSKRLLYVAAATFGVALVTLAVALLQVLR